MYSIHTQHNKYVHSFYVVLVNFSADSYKANVNATSVNVYVTVFGSYDTKFCVQVIPNDTYVTQKGMLLITNIDCNLLAICF